MLAADLPSVEAIAGRLHPDHPESSAVFAERLALAPEGCRVLAAAAGGGLLGYAVTHPWRAAAPPALDTLLRALPAAPDAWHLHDVALLPEARGRGHATALLHAILAAAAAGGLGRVTLVAVAGKAAMWRAHGFRPVAPRDRGRSLASYGAGALFMARGLEGWPDPSPEAKKTVPDMHR